MTLSPFQQIIHDVYTSTRSNLRIDSVAGSGKTTMLSVLAKSLKPGGNYVALAFANVNADDFRTKLPYYVQSSTFHSYCWAGLKSAYPKIKLEKTKTDRIFRDLVKENSIFYSFIQPLKKLVSLAKGSSESLEALIDFHDIECDDPTQLVAYAGEVLKLSLDPTSADFDDMLWLTFRLGVSLVQADELFIDEAQDMNEIQRDLIGVILKTTGRLVIVGDPHQSMYGFRGADVNSMDAMTEAYKLQTYPLSVSYRCSKSVIAEAQRLVPHITATDSAPIGTVGVRSLSLDMFPSGSAIICRNTAPLICLALRLLRANVPCRVLGRDIGAGLKKTVSAFKATDIIDLRAKLNRWLERETRRAKSKAKLAVLEDKFEALCAIISDCSSPADVIARIEFLFKETPATLTLSTIHKSKGLEYDTVFILNRHLMPSKYAESPWQIQQEKNIEYVAITRAKTNLYYINL